MKFGDQVLFLAEDGTEFPATVLNARVLDDHVGADGQPLLDLGYFKQVLDGQGNPKNVIGTSAQLELVQIKHDVAHESHTFAEKNKDRYPGGRWTEMPSASYFTGSVVEGEDEGSEGSEDPGAEE